MDLKIRTARLLWQPCWRIVASRFPPQGLFDRVTRPQDLDTVMAIESLTNDRIRQQAGDLSLVPEAERLVGPGTTPIMAAFTHPNPAGSRFADASYGVYYAAKSIDTALAETRYHKERFLRATNEAPIEVDMRSYASDVDADFHDLRGPQEAFADIYNPDPGVYGPAQALAKSLRLTSSNGLAYDSVRDPSGECVAIFRPTLLSPTRQGEHFCYVWNGKEINSVYIKSAYPQA
ncbi:MAG: RES family NAD+ phosphorylase [Verrucomicrobia bacterium]|nr:RES family NAD+ phosphorylase [Verrucomicrobiota bacterium]